MNDRGCLIVRNLIRPIRPRPKKLREIIEKYRKDRDYKFADFYMDIRYTAFLKTAFNKNMQLAMRHFMKQNFSQEIMINVDWLKVYLPRNHFDLILSDWAVNLVTAKDLPKLLARISGWLKQTGYFFQQTGYVEKAVPYQSAADVIAYFNKQKKININDLRWHLLLSTWRAKTEKLYYYQYSDNLKKHLRLIKMWWRQKRITPKELAGLLVYLNSRKQAVVFKKRTFLTPFKKYFKILDEFPGEQILSRFYLAKKK